MVKTHSGASLLGQTVKAPASPEEAILETRAQSASGRKYLARFTAPEFTSLCPITGQPDFAHLVIDYVPDELLVEIEIAKALSLRRSAITAPSTRIAPCPSARLVAALKPHWLRIGGYWYPRGGIPIDVF